MKKLLLLIVFASLTMNAQIPSYVPTDGLVGYWSFSGNANDASTNANNGTNNGATLSTDRFGNANSAYSFNGTNNKIEVPNSSTLQIQSRGLTISQWVYISGNSNTYTSISKEWDYIKGFYGTYFYRNTNGTYRAEFNVREFAHGLSLPTAVASSQELKTNQWYLVTGTYDFNILKMYINGVLTGSATSTVPMLINSGSLRIGSSGFSYWYKDKLDDIGIWNRALTQDEITNLYNANICYQSITVTDTLIINTGILSYNPVTYNNTITIYPNPASTQVNIAFNNITNLNGGAIKIINSLGQQVATTPITTSGTNTTLTLSTWGGSGLYFVQIVNPQGQIVDIKKIILQ